MLLTPDSYAVSCGCGHTHTVLLQKALIAPGALHSFDALCAEMGFTGRLAAVYDENTYAATKGRRPAAAQEIVLPPEGLHADEHGVQKVLDALNGTPDVLAAVGAGTVHDITRYCAAKLGVPFVSAPTAASVDGFVSTVAAMTWNGFKVTMPAVSPALLVADLDVIAAAPFALTASGVGDILGKYVSLADWRIAHILTGEYYCEGIAALTRSAVDEVMASYAALAGGDTDAYASLMKALVLSGVAMQLAGNSRPASAAEHHISHLIEIGVPWLPHSDALHGEKVGVGTLLASGEYHKWAALSEKEMAAQNPTEKLAHYTTPSVQTLQKAFGPLAGEVQKENTGDCLCHVPPDAVLAKWTQIQAELQSIPAPAEVERVLQTLGAKRTLQDIGVQQTAQGDILAWSPYVRNRLTFMRIRHSLVSA